MADLIVAKLCSGKTELQAEFRTGGRIPSAVLDNLLPVEVAEAVYNHFPSTDRMRLKRSIKEHKLIAAQMDQYDPLLEECVYAFQDPRVVELVGEITGLQELEPDAELYAGGISLMSRGGYLRPHLDNSHDGDQSRYRVLNLLYYVTPHWGEEHGGSLQLWDEGPLTTPRTIASRFNRLVLMMTNQTSWHSVSQVLSEGRRCCVSNYYFSKVAPESQPYFHATSFRGEGVGLADLVMRADNLFRTTVLRAMPGIYKNPHVYKRR